MPLNSSVDLSRKLSLMLMTLQTASVKRKRSRKSSRTFTISSPRDLHGNNLLPLVVTSKTCSTSSQLSSNHAQQYPPKCSQTSSTGATSSSTLFPSLKTLSRLCGTITNSSAQMSKTSSSTWSNKTTLKLARTLVTSSP